VHETEMDRSEGITGNLRVGRNTSGSLVGKQVDYGLEETKILVWFSAKSRDFSLFHREQTRHLLTGYGNFLSYGKAGRM